MTRILGLLCFLMVGMQAVASTGDTNIVNDYFIIITRWFSDLIFAPIYGTNFPWIVVWLIAGALVCTVYFRGIQISGFRHAINLVRGKYAKSDAPGQVSHFQALATALSGTVGLGNIAGVAVAVTIGGPGATFWMIIAGLLGMASKFTECTLGVKYRNENPDGSVSGGGMYYLTKGFKERGLPAGRFLAIMFAVFCIFSSFGAGNMFQVQQMHSQFVQMTGGEQSFLYNQGWKTGLFFAFLVFLVIVGGIKSIVRVTDKMVPLMLLIYMMACFVVLALNWQQIPWAIAQIFKGAFTDMGITGGVIGAIIQGFRRATFSNEAGVGSSAIAHAAVKTNEPVTEGFVALLEPFVDTVIICTCTALVIVISGVLQVDPATGHYVMSAMGDKIATPNGAEGVALTTIAFAKNIAWFPYVLTLVIALFAFSTMISWSYYGVKAWTYLFGEGAKQELCFKLIFCAMVVVGATLKLNVILDFSDAAYFSMGVVNMIGLYCLLPVVRRELEQYRKKNSHLFKK